MADMIQVLPDAVANQIAAGEVIQRPASVVKELLENAVDAGAGHIQLIVRDAGKSLIQVIDDGSGMSEPDARLCFERHATSKIHSADDLFDLYTFGFRGEAMASIAAVAKVNLKTKTAGAETGTCIRIEASSFISQEPCQAPDGTNISVRNLFYNVPARRKFLKSDNAELRHIIEEFQRVALVHPEISFVFHQNDKLVFQLPKSGLKERIVSIFNKNYVHRLVNFQLESSQAKVKGFVTKPEYAKKKRGEQYFFVNGRFFKHSYFHHAVMQAFEGLIRKDFFPSYFIYLTVDPKDLDVNIHPTKTEINFSNQQYLYAMLRSSIQESLGRFNIAPSIDFKSTTPFDYVPPRKGDKIQVPKVTVDPTFNPFEQGQKSSGGTAVPPGRPSAAGWENLYQGLEDLNPPEPDAGEQNLIIPSDDAPAGVSQGNGNHYLQVDNQYILANVKSGLMLVHQYRADYRIQYEKIIDSAQTTNAQTLLFSKTVQLTPEEDHIFASLKDDLLSLGFVFENFGPGAYLFSALPLDFPEGQLEDFLHRIIDAYSFQEKGVEINFRDEIAKNMAKKTAIKGGVKMKNEEMESLINSLFSTRMPEIDPDGKPIVRILLSEELARFF